MKRITTLFFAALLVQVSTSCETLTCSEPSPETKASATLKDLSGLDGCGFVLVLADGSRLEPAGKAWDTYLKHDGEKVNFVYLSEARPSACMSGETVKVLSIEQQQGWCSVPTSGGND